MDPDLELAKRLQAEFEREASVSRQPAQPDLSSLELARRLQAEYDGESASAEMAPFLPPEYRTPQKNSKPLSCVSEEWETIDPTPDLHALFLEFNETYFWGKLLMCEVKWSPRMTTCAGICRYSPREKFCTIGISIPLLKLRPRKDMVETLLHEMIHALLFITDNNDDHDGHGPEFHKHMYRINAATGANISVYHTFHDEVELYKQHWWRCGGPCTKRPPFYGFVKRAMNRAPGPSDRWWGQHQQNCGGTFVKVKEPEGFGKKKKTGDEIKEKVKGSPDIRGFLGGKENKGSSSGVTKPSGSGLKGGSAVGGSGKGVSASGMGGSTGGDSGKSARGKGGFTGGGSVKGVSASGMPKGLWDANEVRSKENSSNGANGGGLVKNIGGFSDNSGGPSVSGGGTSRAGGGPGASGGGGRGNIFGFGGTSFSGAEGGLKTKGKSGTMVVKPGWKTPADNSSGGSAVGGGAELELPSSRFTGASDGSGFRLGSQGGGVGGGGLSAREAARQRWASVDITNSGTNSNSGTSASRPKSTSTSANAITAQNRSIKTPSLSVPSPTLVPCPICNKKLPEAAINQHLDTCLASQDSQEDPFQDDGDDAALLAATVDLEKSINVDSDDEPLVQTKVSLSDSDDEPLIKRPYKRKRDINSKSDQENDELFGDMTAQDDQDILTALEDSTDQNADQSMFACPICDKLLSHNIMFKHLDTCLASM